jgi:hypothetical protein
MRRISVFNVTMVALFFSLVAIFDIYAEKNPKKSTNIHRNKPKIDLTTCIKTYLKSDLNVGLNEGEKAHELVVAGDIVGEKEAKSGCYNRVERSRVWMREILARECV